MATTCADPTFNLDAQARAVLVLLTARPPSFAPYDYTRQRFEADIQTFPWYAGHMRGFALVIRWPKGKKSRVITVTNDITSTGIAVGFWDDGNVPPNGPTVEYRDSVTTASFLVFDAGCLGEVVDYVYSLMAAVYPKEA